MISTSSLSLVVVLRFVVVPEIVRDGRGTSFPVPGNRFRARGRGLGGGQLAPEPFESILCYAILAGSLEAAFWPTFAWIDQTWGQKAAYTPPQKNKDASLRSTKSRLIDLGF